MSLFEAIVNNDITKVKDLLEKDADPNLTDIPIEYACINNKVEILQLLLEYGLDPTTHNSIKSAVYHGYTDILKVLLQDGRIDPAVENNWPIKIASQRGFEDCVALLLQDGRVDPTASGSIRFASQFGHTKVVSLLLEDGRVDPTDENEYAIRLAATKEIKDMLIAYKYRVDGQEYQKMKNLLK